ncbi:MAG TPA: amino acid permease [Verrucomicrobiae bacterium]|nr:amino acid permease [Verrucomicrobiae bacterium]
MSSSPTPSSSNSDNNDNGSTSLKRTIGLFQASIFGIGLILGAGIYSVIGDVAAIGGNIIWISFLIASLLALLIGLSYAKLSSIFPKSAAEYFFVKNSLGNEFIASFIGYLVIFVNISSAATVAIGFSGYMNTFFPNIPGIIIAILLVAVLSFVNFYGIAESANLNVIFTFIELFGLLFIIVASFATGFIFKTNFWELPMNTHNANLNPNISYVFGIIFPAASLIFFAYFGFENIINISDETKNPVKTIPKALIISIIVTTIVYVLVALSSIALVGWQELSQSSAPLATVANKAAGNTGTFLLSVIGLFATSNTVLIMLISSSRIIYGISKDGKFSIPHFLSTVHEKRKTPWIAILFVMVITFIIIVFSEGDLSIIAMLSVFGIFMVYIIVNVSVIIFSHKNSNNIAKSLRIEKASIISIISITLTTILLIQLGLETIKIGLISISLILFFLLLVKLVNRSTSNTKPRL